MVEWVGECGREGKGPQKVRCGHTTLLQPRLHSASLHSLSLTDVFHSQFRVHSSLPWESWRSRSRPSWSALSWEPKGPGVEG